MTVFPMVIILWNLCFTQPKFTSVVDVLFTKLSMMKIAALTVFLFWTCYGVNIGDDCSEEEFCDYGICANGRCSPCPSTTCESHLDCSRNGANTICRERRRPLRPHSLASDECSKTCTCAEGGCNVDSDCEGEFVCLDADTYSTFAFDSVTACRGRCSSDPYIDKERTLQDGNFTPSTDLQDTNFTPPESDLVQDPANIFSTTGGNATANTTDTECTGIPCIINEDCAGLGLIECVFNPTCGGGECKIAPLDEGETTNIVGENCGPFNCTEGNFTTGNNTSGCDVGSPCSNDFDCIPGIEICNSACGVCQSVSLDGSDECTLGSCRNSTDCQNQGFAPSDECIGITPGVNLTECSGVCATPNKTVACTVGGPETCKKGLETCENDQCAPIKCESVFSCGQDSDCFEGLETCQGFDGETACSGQCVLISGCNEGSCSTSIDCPSDGVTTFECVGFDGNAACTGSCEAMKCPGQTCTDSTECADGQKCSGSNGVDLCSGVCQTFSLRFRNYRGFRLPHFGKGHDFASLFASRNERLGGRQQISESSRAELSDLKSFLD